MKCLGNRHLQFILRCSKFDQVQECHVTKKIRMRMIFHKIHMVILPVILLLLLQSKVTETYRRTRKLHKRGEILLVGLKSLKPKYSNVFRRILMSNDNSETNETATSPEAINLTSFKSMEIEDSTNWSEEASTASSTTLEDKRSLLKWGDPCIPIDEPYVDACMLATESLPDFLALFCEEKQKTCQCLMDEEDEPAKWSREQNRCLMPLYYGCKNNLDCEKQYICRRAVESDYDRDPDIPAGYPLVCTSKLANRGNKMVNIDQNTFFYFFSIIFPVVVY